MHRQKSLFTFLFCLCSFVPQSLLATEVDAGSIDPDNWPQYHRTSNAWRYSPLDQINTENVDRLRVAWIHQPGDITNGLQTTPIVVDGVVYYAGPFDNVFAIDAASGKSLWEYRPELDDIAYEVLITGINRGVTVGHGMVYLGTLDGRFIALDQLTGKEKWSRQITEPRKCGGCVFTASPQLAGDVLFGGSTGGDFATAAKIYAVDAMTGESVWEFDVIKDDEESWPNGSGEYGGGGAWMPGTYDEASDTIYIGTGNAAADFYGENRKGDNKYTATLMALEPSTGKLKWHHQETPHDLWDFDSAYEALIVKNKGVEYIVHLNKSGFTFVYNKESGRLLNVWKFAENINFADGIDINSGKFINRVETPVGEDGIQCPSFLGGRSFNHGAYNPNTGLWYLNGFEACLRTKPTYVDPASLGYAQANIGTDKLEMIPPPGKKASARLVALDPMTGVRKWRIDYPLPGLGSVLTTGGNLVFNSELDGVFNAYHAESGKVLWHFRSSAGSRGGTVSYAVKGKQYILTTSGFSGFVVGQMATVFPKIRDIPGGGLLIAFTLDEER
ncbi:MAG: alcohol dehydrogenase (cytochrome c) [Gammaproteobacteria bacterium]|jgi:alcohol dehydrogenase (cytochrome c)